MTAEPFGIARKIGSGRAMRRRSVRKASENGALLIPLADLSAHAAAASFAARQRCP